MKSVDVYSYGVDISETDPDLQDTHLREYLPILITKFLETLDCELLTLGHIERASAVGSKLKILEVTCAMHLQRSPTRIHAQIQINMLINQNVIMRTRVHTYFSFWNAWPICSQATPG